MSSLRARALCGFAVSIALPLFAQLDRDELMKHPKYAETDRKPVFKKMTAEEVRAAVKVTASRSSAFFGYDTPEVQVHLPRVDNSNYIEDDFSEPKLFDKKNKEVKYEKEQGIYDHDTWSTEVRFNSLDQKKPLQFAKAVGTVHIKYPVAMHTRTIRKSDKKAADDAGVEFDGPVIKTDLTKIPESAFGSPLEGVRAYDKTGKRLERVLGYSLSGMSNGMSYRGYAFQGDVTRVDVDVADEWTNLEINYEMPPAPKLTTMPGTPSTAEETITETPGGKYTVKVVALEASDD